MCCWILHLTVASYGCILCNIWFLQENWTALHLAAEGGHWECVEVLLRAGANKDAQTKVASKQKKTVKKVNK
jgi:uncharacterized membrane protein